MTAKDKALELVGKYYQLAESIEWTDDKTKVKAEKFNDELGTDVLKYWNELAKQCAMASVDEILNSNMIHLHLYQMDFWEEVTNEIEKL